MRPQFVPPLDLRALAGWLPRIGPGATSALHAVLRWSARHPSQTGLRAVLLTIVVFGFSWRVVRRSFRVLVEVLVALVLLGAATRFGWLTW